MQLTKAMSLALAPKGIRVNAVGPGSIDTDMMAGVNANPEAMARVMSRTPLGRVGSAREIGDVVLRDRLVDRLRQQWRHGFARLRGAQQRAQLALLGLADRIS